MRKTLRIEMLDKKFGKSAFLRSALVFQEPEEYSAVKTYHFQPASMQKALPGRKRSPMTSMIWHSTGMFPHPPRSRRSMPWFSSPARRCGERQSPWMNDPISWNLHCKTYGAVLHCIKINTFHAVKSPLPPFNRHVGLTPVQPTGRSIKLC